MFKHLIRQGYQLQQIHSQKLIASALSYYQQLGLRHNSCSSPSYNNNQSHKPSDYITPSTSSHDAETIITKSTSCHYLQPIHNQSNNNLHLQQHHRKIIIIIYCSSSSKLRSMQSSFTTITSSSRNISIQFYHYIYQIILHYQGMVF